MRRSLQTAIATTTMYIVLLSFVGSPSDWNVKDTVLRNDKLVLENSAPKPVSVPRSRISRTDLSLKTNVVLLA